MLNSTEKKIYDILEPVAKDLGYEIVKVVLSGSNRKVLDIAIDKIEEGSITIKDCRTASNHFSALLDVEDVISDRYYLEVGSAGIERPLVKKEDFEKFKGKIIQVKTHKAINESKKFQGILGGIENDIVHLNLEKDQKLDIEYENIKGAKLVFTEEMFRQSLKK